MLRSSSAVRPRTSSARTRGFHSRTIEIFDQRGIVDRFLAEGRTAQGLRFGNTSLDLGDLPSRHPYTLGLGQNHIERILLGWVEELGVPIRRGLEVTEETPTGIRLDDVGLHAINVMEDGRAVGIVVTEQQLGPATEPTLADLSEALTAVYGTDFGIHHPTWM
jgi:3-(3-hydroxy-phenyl)propionate hydroxylase